MKVKISGYSTWWAPHKILLPLKWLFNISDDDYYRGVHPDYESVLSRFEDTFIGRFLKKQDYRYKQKIKVKIVRSDVFSGDHTLAYIIHPFLIKYKEEAHSSALVDSEDLPDYLKEETGYEPRWNYILDEMIFAFGAINDPEREHQFYSGDVDWVFEKEDDGKYVELKHGPNHTFTVDKEAQKVYEDRIQNGLRLFGKYYQSLWI